MDKFEKSASTANNRANLLTNTMVIITILAGFTKLRFGAFGLSELCTAFLFIHLYWSKNRFCIRKMIFTQFWLLTILINCVGLFINVLFGIDYLSIQSGSALFDMVAYLYMLILCFTFESVLTNWSYDEVWTLFRRIFYSAVLIIGTLFVVSQFRQTLFGMSLFYGEERFSPLADNPHQINVLTSTLPFIGFKILKEAKSLESKTVTSAFLAANLLVSLSTRSDTMKVVYIVCFYLMIVIRERGSRQEKPSYLAAISVSLIAFAGILYFWDWFVGLIIRFFEEGDAGGVRFILWRNSVQAGMRSPIFGLGPGAHTGFYGPFEAVESHQMLLTMFTQSGLIGVTVLMALVFKVVRTVYKDKHVFIMVVGLLISSLSGTMLRRTVWWIYMMICYHLVQRINDRLPT